jgi:hypothetical protein
MEGNQGTTRVIGGAKLLFFAHFYWLYRRRQLSFASITVLLPGNHTPFTKNLHSAKDIGNPALLPTFYKGENGRVILTVLGTCYKARVRYPFLVVLFITLSKSDHR